MMIEICCGSYEDGLNAYLNGIKRIELNSALHLGGLTPSLASLKLLKQETDLICICMVRPRGAGFYYSKEEYQQMKLELVDLLENGADGIAFGFLTSNFQIDEERTKEFVEIIHKYNKVAVFHRAFDCSKNIDESIQLLIRLGVDRVLTSGMEATAIQGQECIKHLIEKYGNQIEILPGSGINAKNVKAFMKYTNASQIHSSCRTYKEDITTTFNNVNYSYLEKPNHNCFDYVNPRLIQDLFREVNE